MEEMVRYVASRMRDKGVEVLVDINRHAKRGSYWCNNVGSWERGGAGEDERLNLVQPAMEKPAQVCGAMKFD